ncbi:MAG: sigma-70 family RNA polymerase sigma factor, partial [Bacteroidales bacterium]|nr:sigma-70 family RNA polymerase sigma factor [Bacteroidales bacterium]
GCKKGKRNSQELLYKTFASKMYAVCLYYSGNKEEAEDFLHNGFLKVFDKINQYQNKGSFEAWIRRIFMNTALEKYRAKFQTVKIDESALEQQVFSNEDILSKISANDLIQLIQKLTPAYRMVFNLYAIEGYSHSEISQMLGISEGTSKSNLSRARMHLQQQLSTQPNWKNRVG